jgi:hypothetical protein
LTGSYTEQTFAYGDGIYPDRLTAFDGKAIGAKLESNQEEELHGGRFG